MILFDRLFCDCCGQYVGQLFTSRASFSELSFFVPLVCPDCDLERDVINVVDVELFC